MTHLGQNYEHERLLKYARAFGVANDPSALARWQPLIERVIMVADEEVVATLSEHASAHNHHLELTRRELSRLERRADAAMLDHNCAFFQTSTIEHCASDKDSFSPS